MNNFIRHMIYRMINFCGVPTVNGAEHDLKELLYILLKYGFMNRENLEVIINKYNRSFNWDLLEAVLRLEREASTNEK